MTTASPTSGIDKLDLLFKNRLGRLGFDSKLPWYEEKQAFPELIPAEVVMGDKLPFDLPSLLQGGRIQINLNNKSFDSQGGETSADSGVVKARIRVPLRAVRAYGEEAFYVFVCDELKNSCKKFGHVVEILKEEENVIDVIEDDFHVLNNHVILSDSTLPVEAVLFVSFYEYIGSRGLVVTDSVTNSVVAPVVQQVVQQETVDSRGVTIRTSDEINEGIFHLFYNDLRFKESFSKMTTDDLRKGEETLQNELTLKGTQEEELNLIRQQIPLYLSDLSVSPGYEQFNSNVFKSYFNDQILDVTTDDIQVGTNKYLSETSLLELITSHEILRTNLVQEAPENLYFTEERTKRVLEDTLLSLNFVEKIGLIESECRGGLLSVSYDIAILELSVQCFLATQEQIQSNIESLSTDLILEGSNLYYTDSRVSEHEGFISVSACLDLVREEMRNPPTQSDLLPVLENWFSEKSLDELSDGENRKLISDVEIREKIYSEMPRSTDDLSEGNNKYFSDALVAEVLRRTSSDILVEGESTYKASKVQNEIHNVVKYLTLDEILDGETYTRLSVGDIDQIVDDKLNPMTQSIDTRLTELDSRLTLETDDRTELGCLLEDLNVPSIQLRIDADVLSVQEHLDSVEERLQGCCSVQQHLNTSLIPEAEPSLYFNTERCLSVCEPLLVSALSTCESSLMPLNTRLAELQTQVSAGGLVSSMVIERHDILEANVSVAFLSVSAQLQDLDASQANDRKTLHDLLESSVATEQSLTELSVGFPNLVSEIGAANEKMNSISEEITDSFESLQTWKDGIDSWKENFLQVTTENLIENNAHLFFNAERSLSVHEPLYERVSAVESNLTTLKTSSATLSDDRLKSNEVPISNGIAVVSSLTPLRYKMVLSLGQNESEAFDDVGFIAQDVAQIESLAHAVVPGTETVPFSLDYHSIITYAVAAVKETILSVSSLDAKYEDLDDKVEQDRSNFDTRFTEMFRTGVNSDDLQEGVLNKFAPEFTGIALKLEEFKFLLQQIDTDQIPQGEVNLYNQQETAITTDDVPEGNNSLYFTVERCQLILDDLVKDIHVDDVTETDTKGFLTLSRLLHELKFVTADHIGNGLTNRFLNRDTFIDLGITTEDIPEGESNTYLTPHRVREAVTGMSIDLFADGNTNLFCSKDNVQVLLGLLNTGDLPEAQDKRYVSRDAYLELNISVGDILNNDILARSSEVNEQLQLTLSVATLNLESQINQVQSTLEVNFLSTNNSLSTSHAGLSSSLSTSHAILLDTLSTSHASLRSSLSASDANFQNSLSTSHNLLSQDIHLSQNEINTLYSLVSTSSIQIELNNQLIAENTLSINNNASSILDVSLKVIEVDMTLSLGFLSLSNEVSLITQDLNGLTTEQIAETSTRKYVSKRAMSDMQITTDEIIQGNSNKYTTTASVRDVLASLTSSDLPEGSSHLYVSKTNVINTGLKPNELNDFSNSIDVHLASISTDKLPEGSQNQYFTEERVRYALSTASTDDLIEGTGNKYFTSDRVHAIISASSSSDIQEGSNLYFTTNRVLETISVATTDALPQGTTNLYLTKSNLLSLNFDVSELNNSFNSLLTTDSFLSQVSINLTTDLIQEGNQKYVSHESLLSVLEQNLISTDSLKEGDTNTYFTHDRVKNIIDETFDTKFEALFQSKTTDDLPQGLDVNNFYFTETTLAQTLTSSHIIETGITAENLGARPASLSINALEIVESPNALFFNTQRFDLEFQQKTTDDLTEGNNQFFSKDRVIQALSSIGDLSVVLTSASPGLLEVSISVSDEQTLGAKIHLLLEGETFMTQENFELTNASISKTFTNLNPEDLTVTTKLETRYGSQTDEQQILVDGELPSITSITFAEITPGFSDKILISLGGHGNCELLISSNNYEIYNGSVNLFEQSQVEIALSCVFDIANFTLRRNGVVLHSVLETMNVGLVLPMKRTFDITTNTHFDALQTTPFAGIVISIQDDTRDVTLDGNKFHSNENPLGAILSARQNFINYGTSTGKLTTNLIDGVNAFISFA